MAVTSGFFNSIAHDRLYDAVQMSSMFDGIINDGVLISYKDKLMVEPGTGMAVNVGEGKAWFRHTWTLNQGKIVLAIEDSDTLKPRIDMVYLEVNNGDRANKIALKKGDYPADSTDGSEYKPEKPTLEETATMKQYPLAYITIDPGITEIDATKIENAVGTEACPFANGLIEQVTVEKLYAQWGSQFDSWWKDLRKLMSLDEAQRTGDLQNQIDELNQWISSQTIPATSTVFTITHSYFKMDGRLVEVYYNNDSLSEVSRRNPKYTVEDGKLTITFDSALSTDVIIDNIRVTIPKYATSAV